MENLSEEYIKLKVVLKEQITFGGLKGIPKSFYDGTTGIDPLDSSIKKFLTQDIIIY